MVNTNKEKILDLFYNIHYKASNIADVIGVSLPYITKVIKADVRYNNEKLTRKQITVEKHRKANNMNMKKVREQKKIDDDYNYIQEQHRQASCELSKNKHLSNESFRNWNASAYTYNDKKRRFEFRNNLGRAADVPKYVKVNI